MVNPMRDCGAAIKATLEGSLERQDVSKEGDNTVFQEKVKHPDLRESALSSGSKQLKRFRKSLKLTRYTRPPHSFEQI